MSKLTHHSQPPVVSFSTAPPLQINASPVSGYIPQSLIASFSTVAPMQLNAYLASGHTSQPLVAFSLTPPLQLSASPASGHISQQLVASSVSAEHLASQDFNKSADTSTPQQPHKIISQSHAASEQLATPQHGISQFAEHSATVLNIPAICDHKIQIDATMSSLCTNPEQSSSPQTLADELSLQEQLTKLEIMCAEMQNANEQLIREAAQHKQVDEVLTDCIEKRHHIGGQQMAPERVQTGKCLIVLYLPGRPLRGRFLEAPWCCGTS
jgi:hypothetical protein